MLSTLLLSLFPWTNVISLHRIWNFVRDDKCVDTNNRPYQRNPKPEIKISFTKAFAENKINSSIEYIPLMSMFYTQNSQRSFVLNWQTYFLSQLLWILLYSRLILIFQAFISCNAIHCQLYVSAKFHVIVSNIFYPSNFYSFF